jgi:hypothetical protein
MASGHRVMISETQDSVARTWYLWMRQLLHYLEVENPGTYIRYLIPLVFHLKTLLKHNGQMAAVQHLKVTLFALYSYVAGNPLSSTMPLGFGVRLHHGLPAVWHREIRERIRGNTLWVIRLMASLLNVYRSMDAKHPEMDTASIIQPHPNLKDNPMFIEYQKFCADIFPKLLGRKFGKKGIPPFTYESALGMLVRSAGPNLSGPGSAGLILDAKAWIAAPVNHVASWFDMHEDTVMKDLLHMHAAEEHFTPEPLVQAGKGMKAQPVTTMGVATLSTRVPAAVANQIPGVDGGPAPVLGRLHTIDEPAGKVRVVAICDYWTQAALKPVHDFLFKILRRLHENDATFDQEGVVDAYFAKDFHPH